MAFLNTLCPVVRLASNGGRRKPVNVIAEECARSIPVGEGLMEGECEKASKPWNNSDVSLGLENSTVQVDRDVLEEKYDKVYDALCYEGYERFSGSWNNSDVILVVEGYEFHVHRAVLGIYSPVFLAMFSCEGFSEKSTDEIPLPDKKALEFLDLLNQLYVEIEMNPITMESVEHLLKLADEYQITVVMERCRKVLNEQSLNTDNALRILMLGQKYNFEELRKKCYPVLKRLTLESLQSRPQYDEMDEESHKQVVTARLEESEKILPDVERVIWAFLRYIIRKQDEFEPKRHGFMYQQRVNYIPPDFQKWYAENPQDRSFFDSIIKSVHGDSPNIKDSFKKLNMLGLDLPG